MEPFNLISEIKPLVASDHLDNRPRHLPFTMGQLLQGRVEAQHGPRQFTLNLGGQQLLAESGAQLQVGQQLKVQVVALTPQVQLQVVSNDPITSRLSTGVHLLSQQNDLASQLSTLAKQTYQAPQLSSSAQQTLQALSNHLTATPAGSPLSSPISSLIAQGAAFLRSTADTQVTPHLHEMAAVMRQLANVLPEPHRQQATLFAERLTATQSSPGVATGVEATPPTVSVTVADVAPAWTALLRHLEQLAPTLQPLLQQLPTLFQQAPDLPSTRLVQQLFTWLATIPAAATNAQPSPQFNGQLQQTWQQLGLNLEQLLIQGKTKEASQSAKFALMAFAQQGGIDEESAAQAHSLVKSIELYQLVQLRLAPEGTQFLPLPFSFLQQGFILIDTERGKQQSKAQAGNETDTKHLSLHLQLEGLGNLVVDIRQQGEAISLKFQAHNIERAQFLSSHRQDLEQWLTSGTLQSVQFLAGAEEPAKTLLKRLVQGATGMVDTQA